MRIFLQIRATRAVLAFTFTSLLFPGGRSLAAEPTAPARFASAGLRDLTGIRILHTTYDNFAGVPTTFIGDLESRGAVVEVLDHTTNPYPRLDATYDILFLQALGRVPSGQDLASLLAWVRSGGKSILFEGQTYWLIGTANLLSDSLDAGWTCRSISPGPSTITDILAHPITEGVGSVEEITSYYTEFIDISAPAGALLRRPQGQVVGAYTTLENSRMAYIGMSLLWNNRINRADNRRLGNQAIDWLAEIAGTVSTEPSTWSRLKSTYRE